MVKVKSTCARCGCNIDGFEYAVTVHIFTDKEQGAEHFILCEQCMTTLKEVFEDGSVC